MKKIFTLISMAMMAVSMNAQKIVFEEGQNPKDGFANGDFKIAVVDDNDKLVVDANSAWFGDADESEKFSYRLKSGGKSSSKNNLTVTVPSAGVLKICARTGSNSATDRNVVITQNEEELFNQIVQEADAVMVKGKDESDPEKESKVYPVISVNVAAGDVAVTYPVGSINFYCFEFVGGATGIDTVKASNMMNAAYNLAGQRVNAHFKGIIVKNGIKYMAK